MHREKSNQFARISAHVECKAFTGQNTELAYHLSVNINFNQKTIIATELKLFINLNKYCTVSL